VSVIFCREFNIGNWELPSAEKVGVFAGSCQCTHHVQVKLPMRWFAGDECGTLSTRNKQTGRIHNLLPVISYNDSVRIEHWDDFEDKRVSQELQEKTSTN